ncbi:DUF1361 domain-containing protein [Tamlana sp. 2201CG12-4]|uniref:DUF1361 domain-containing protein n=1 Tax=Tamlana sp. 2201CG12-4 TaxID=3112582 RepID=UPI003FA387F0
MNHIKQLLFNRFKTFSLITISISFSIVLLMIRMKLTHSYFYLFLVWNLFLAVVPFTITTYLSSLPKLNKYILFFWFSVWLLFLPNAPYIVTDLLHIKISTSHLLWLDVLLITSFALNGLALFYFSLIDMKIVLTNIMNVRQIKSLIFTIPFLCGFGVYLGRFLRYNSWEIISNPRFLITDILNILIKPFHHTEAWLFTLLFGTFLSIGLWVFNCFYSNPST